MAKFGQSKLKKNFSDWAIFSIINNAKIQDKEVIGWRLIGGKKVTAQVKIRVIRKSRDEIVIIPVSDVDMSDFNTVLSGMDKLNIYLPNDMVLFQSIIKYKQQDEVVISIPKMIAQIDRRNYLRLVARPELNIRLSFYKKGHTLRENVQSFDKPCFDISAGGLSFVISRLESKFFKVGDYISKMNLMIGDIKIPLNGEVVNIFEVNPEHGNNLHYKGWKICMKYKGINDKLQQLIDNYVFKNIDSQIDVI